MVLNGPPSIGARVWLVRGLSVRFWFHRRGMGGFGAFSGGVGRGFGCGWLALRFVVIWRAACLEHGFCVEGKKKGVA